MDNQRKMDILFDRLYVLKSTLWEQMKLMAQEANPDIDVIYVIAQERQGIQERFAEVGKKLGVFDDQGRNVL